MKTMRSELRGILGSTVLLGCAALGLTGCAADGGAPFGVVATEEWVRSHVRQQINVVEAKVAQVDTRVTQVDGRVTQVSGQTAEARKVADDGVRRANAADARLTQALANRYKRTLVDTMSLRYAPNQFLLTSEHTSILGKVLKVLEDQPAWTIDIVGYTDATGGTVANNQLSWRREEVVRRYLTEKAQVIHRISFIGLGEEKAHDLKANAADRHVTIAIYKPTE